MFSVWQRSQRSSSAARCPSCRAFSASSGPSLRRLQRLGLLAISTTARTLDRNVSRPELHHKTLQTHGRPNKQTPHLPRWTRRTSLWRRTTHPPLAQSPLPASTTPRSIYGNSTVGTRRVMTGAYGRQFGLSSLFWGQIRGKGREVKGRGIFELDFGTHLRRWWRALNRRRKVKLGPYKSLQKGLYTYQVRWPLSSTYSILAWFVASKATSTDWLG